MTYDELYNKYKGLTASILGDITITDIEKEVLANVTLKPYQTFQKLNDIKEILNNRKEHLENTLSLIDELIEALDRQHVELALPAPKEKLTYKAFDKADYQAKLSKAREMRAQGLAVELIREEN